MKLNSLRRKDPRQGLPRPSFQAQARIYILHLCVQQCNKFPQQLHEPSRVAVWHILLITLPSEQKETSNAISRVPNPRNRFRNSQALGTRANEPPLKADRPNPRAGSPSPTMLALISRRFPISRDLPKCDILSGPQQLAS